MEGEAKMSNNSITKEAIANGLKDLLMVRTLAKISVKDITDYCNISRNTFYYHFQDKYELINWIFYTDMLKNVNSFDDPRKVVDSFVNVCKCLYTNRKFYLACFQYVGQNSLYEYLYDFYYKLWEINIDICYSEAGVKLTEEESRLMASMKTHSLIGIISDWIRDGMHDDYLSYFEKVSTVLKIEDGFAVLANNRFEGNESEEYDMESPEIGKEKRVC